MDKPALTSNNISKRGRSKSDFPKDSLEDALRIPMIIEESNAGQPYPPADTAIAMNYSPGSSGYRILLSSALKYGLTSGTYKSDYITLTPLGSSIVAPTSADLQNKAKVQAALGPPTFKTIYDYYRGKKLPDQQFFENTVVREFSVPKDHAAKCYTVFMANMESVGFIRKASTGLWLSSEPVTAPDIAPAIQEAEEEEIPGPEIETPDEAIQPPVIENENNKVFITHGKDRKIVDQIKKLLVFGNFDPVLSVEGQTNAKPVPDKVMDDMRTCSAAIVHVGAESTLIDKEGNEQQVINPNVLIEIGAAMALYNHRFILLVKRGVTLPSNLQGLYEVRYEGSELDHESTMALLEAFASFRTKD